MKKANRRPFKEAQWRAHISGAARSGMSAREYCRRHRISECRFFYWRRRLRETAAESGFDRIPVAAVAEAGSPGPGVSIRFPSGARIEFQGVPRAEWLLELLKLVA